MCFRPSSRIGWPTRPHLSYLSLASSRRSTPELRFSKRLIQSCRQSCESGHTQSPTYHLWGSIDHLRQDGLRRASRCCLNRDNAISGMKTDVMQAIFCHRSTEIWERLEVPILRYLLKKSPSSSSDKDMMTREYWMLPIFASTSFQTTSYSSWGRIIWTYNLCSVETYESLFITSYRMSEWLIQYGRKGFLLARWMLRIDVRRQGAMWHIRLWSWCCGLEEVEHGR